ncbi:hypothetical protein [Cysteiniphilum sp. 6C5]|uniref:hypothetical protein n=1 Tax=unclassified Cysteiniphilum TaxID=2610889 RepID=UPI003F84A2EF
MKHYCIVVIGLIGLIKVLSFVDVSYANYRLKTQLKDQGNVLTVNQMSFFVPKKDSVCAYEIIEQKDQTSTHSYNCQLHIYHNAEDNSIVLTYEIKGQWTTQYSQGEDGWHWRITEVPNPTSTLQLYSPFYLEFKDMGVKMSIVSPTSLYSQLTINGGLLVVGRKLHTLSTVANISLSSGYPVFEGSIKWGVHHTVSV